MYESCAYYTEYFHWNPTGSTTLKPTSFNLQKLLNLGLLCLLSNGTWGHNTIRQTPKHANGTDHGFACFCMIRSSRWAWPAWQLRSPHGPRDDRIIEADAQEIRRDGMQDVVT